MTARDHTALLMCKNLLNHLTLHNREMFTEYGSNYISTNSEDFYQQTGFRVLGKICDQAMPTASEMRQLINIMETEGQHIFDEDIGQPTDRKQLIISMSRDQHSMYGNMPDKFSCLDTFHRNIMLMCPRHYEDYSFHPSLLYSSPNSRTVQVPHHDMHDSENPDTNFLLLAALVDYTSFILFMGSHKRGKEINNCLPPKRLILNRGEVLMFHPRLIHSGDVFNHKNVRIHYYVHPATRTFINDSTYTPTESTLEAIQKGLSESVAGPSERTI